MRIILIGLVTLTIMPFYAFNRSDNILLYDETITPRHTVYMQEFAVQGSSGASGGSSGNSSGGSGVSASFIGQGNSTNNVSSDAWSGSDGTYTVTHGGLMGTIKDSETGEALSLSDFSLSTKFTPTEDDPWPCIGGFITSDAGRYDIWFNFFDDWETGEPVVSVRSRKFSDDGNIASEGEAKLAIGSVSSGKDIAISVINDTLVAEYNGTTIYSFTDAGLSSNKTLDIGASENATLTDFLLKE